MWRFRCLAIIIMFLTSCSTSTKQEVMITDFSFPWADKTVPKTEFRAHVVDDHLFFKFTADDAEVIVQDQWRGETTVREEDRVEIFIAADEELKNYWCLEIDPRGRVHDYSAHHYRQFDSSWNCRGLTTLGERTPTGYTVHGSIPLATLRELLNQPITRGSEIRIGLFRAEFYGDGPATHGMANDNWLSWVRPTSEKPDFHIPSAFRMWRIP